MTAGGYQLPEIVHDYLKNVRQRGGTPTTVTDYRNVLRLVDRWLLTNRATTLDQATAEDMQAWRDSLTVADSTITTYGKYLQCFFSWACKTGKLAANPAEDMPIPRRKRQIPRPIAEEPLEFAIACAPPRVRPWLILAAYAGLRCCEIARLRREDVLDTRRPRALHIHGKGDKDRIVLASPIVWAGIKDDLPKNGWLYRRCDGKPGPNTANIICKVGNRHLASCGIDETMHTLRHRFATVALDETGDLRALQEALGHADLGTTAGYTLVSDPAAWRLVMAAQPKRGRGRPRLHRPDPA